MKVASNGVPPSISKRVLLRVQCKLFIPHTLTHNLHVYISVFSSRKLSKVFSIAQVHYLRSLLTFSSYFSVRYLVDNTLFFSVYPILCWVSFYNCLRILHVLDCIVFVLEFFSPLLFSIRLVWFGFVF